MAYFTTKDLAVGYDGNVLIHDIDIDIEKGKILTLIGPNGAGKSTILKSITRHLAKISGQVWMDGHDVYQWASREMAKQVAVVLTDRIRPELMTCQELVAMGRYPYTNALGKLTPQDEEAVNEALSDSRRRMAEFDLEYVRGWSLGFDLRILWKTAELLFSKGRASDAFRAPKLKEEEIIHQQKK
jgi:ABC-type cobalamin/Fe3+-siderophores transport system ATPase subunit